MIELVQWYPLTFSAFFAGLTVIAMAIMAGVVSNVGVFGVGPNTDARTTTFRSIPVGFLILLGRLLLMCLCVFFDETYWHWVWGK